MYRRVKASILRRPDPLAVAVQRVSGTVSRRPAVFSSTNQVQHSRATLLIRIPLPSLDDAIPSKRLFFLKTPITSLNNLLKTLTHCLVAPTQKRCGHQLITTAPPTFTSQSKRTTMLALVHYVYAHNNQPHRAGAPRRSVSWWLSVSTRVADARIFVYSCWLRLISPPPPLTLDFFLSLSSEKKRKQQFSFLFLHSPRRPERNRKNPGLSARFLPPPLSPRLSSDLH